MLDHGKHVLCEKPLCINEGQSKRLLAHAQAKKLFLMEAIWSRFFPSYIQLKDRIDAGELGDIQQVDVAFGFPLADVDRLRMKQLGGGTVLDLGVYTIQVILWAFRAAPTKIVAKGKLNEDGVDLEVSDLTLEKLRRVLCTSSLSLKLFFLSHPPFWRFEKNAF